LALGLPAELPKLEILKAWREKTRSLKPFSPVEVSSGPVTENILASDRLDLGIFPTPKWHEHDGGRYIGTGDMVITKDPDSGWINVGTYRACVVDKSTTLWIIDHKHGDSRAKWASESDIPSPASLTASPRLGRRRPRGQGG
jgi:UbiD family decarboxylase